MPSADTQFTAANQPEGTAKRRPKKEKYAGYIAQAEDLLAAYFPDAAQAAIEIASGRAIQHLINHKTGMVHEVPVDPATRLKAVQFITERIAGKPDSTKTHELGEGAAGVFRVLLGGAAQDHWDTSLAAPVEASFAALPAPTEESFDAESV